MIVPTRWAMMWLAVAALCCVIAAFDSRLILVAVALNFMVFFAVWSQGKRLRDSQLTVRRTWAGQPQAGRETVMHVTIQNADHRPVEATIRQPWPHGFSGEAAFQSVHVGARQSVTLDLTTTPDMRGPMMLPDIEVDLTRPMALGACRKRFSEDALVTVYPNLLGIRDYDRLRRSRAFRAAGFHRQRMVGVGREFDQLREYNSSDDYNDINWKATARTGEPHTNLYQAEKSRDLIICLDGGRMMGNPIGKHTTLDHAIDAALLLAHAGHDQGDRVGLITFRDRVDKVVKPAMRNGAVLLKTMAAFDPQPVFPSYLSLVETLRSKQTHRALVVILTDLNDPQLSQDLTDLMPMLVSRHLVVVVSLRDMLAERLASGKTEAVGGDVHRVLAARSLVEDQEQTSVAFA